MGLIKNRSAPVGKAIQDLSQFKMPVFVGDFRRLENSKAWVAPWSSAGIRGNDCSEIRAVMQGSPVRRQRLTSWMRAATPTSSIT